ncbi:MAG: hypothetical protein DWQ02_13730 [Bacteroidetes bacterium]|nr:MAG: hypothetical protein DWQ02_13730 [Bacteroidota bacterium]
MRILIIALALFITTTGFSQGIIDKMADLNCQCMEEKGVDNKTSTELTNIMTDCLTQNLIANLAQFQQELNVEITDQEAMTKVGEQIGMKMATYCPNTVMALANGSIEEEVEAFDEENTFSGQITKVSSDDLLTQLFVKTPQGKVESFIWFGAFDGDEALLELRESIIGTNVTIQYEELGIFNSKQGEYITRKIITGARVN